MRYPHRKPHHSGARRCTVPHSLRPIHAAVNAIAALVIDDPEPNSTLLTDLDMLTIAEAIDLAEGSVAGTAAHRQKPVAPRAEAYDVSRALAGVRVRFATGIDRHVDRRSGSELRLGTACHDASHCRNHVPIHFALLCLPAVHGRDLLADFTRSMVRGGQSPEAHGRSSRSTLVCGQAGR
jgi:hypothetical protein